MKDKKSVAYYYIYLKHKETGIEVKIDRFELSPDSTELLMKKIMNLVPKELRKTDWQMDIQRLNS